MMYRLPHAAVLAIVGLMLSGPASADSSEDIASAYEAYVQGNLEEALAGFEKAANAGNVTAQDSLGVMYANGEGTERDYVSAFMWFIIASRNVPDDDSVWKARLAEFMAEASVHMTEGQIAQAEKLAEDWTPSP